MMSKIIQPTYICKLPSTGESVKYRPFTVKEEKALLLAIQEDSIHLISDAIKNTISVCTFEKINADEIAYYDSEFLFLQIRSKSVGEIIELEGLCECNNKKIPINVDISSAKISPKPSGLLKLSVTGTPYSIELRHPSLSEFVASFIDKEESEFITVAKCIVTVYNGEEVFDWDINEKIEFVESMSPKQQKVIAEFIESMPAVSLDASYVCNKCGKKYENTISGFDNFFV